MSLLVGVQHQRALEHLCVSGVPRSRSAPCGAAPLVERRRRPVVGRVPGATAQPRHRQTEMLQKYSRSTTSSCVVAGGVRPQLPVSTRARARAAGRCRTVLPSTQLPRGRRGTWVPTPRARKSEDACGVGKPSRREKCVAARRSGN